ncbi:MAG: COX15/CtaA family protein [Pseudomonadota bacterium]
MVSVTLSSSKPFASLRSLGLWLLGVAAMIFAMAVIGAITRLTESGLSIMEWAPVTGTLPPLSTAEWERVFALYRTIPEYQLINAGMTLEEFKTIFWWEWIHRLWGRLIGLVYAVPFIWFLWRRKLPGWLVPHLWIALALGALQGFMGWYMVASGFTDRTDVSQYRLVMHLGLALVIYGYLLVLALRLLEPPSLEAQNTTALRWATLGLLGLLVVTLVSGGLVAGLNAGLVYNSYPYMDGEIVPRGYGLLQPWLMNWFENPTAVQFNHRFLAHLVVIGALLLAVWGWLRGVNGSQKQALALVALAAVGQFLLGIVTLINVVPVSLGALHQAGAILLLSALLLLLHRCRGPVAA